MCQNHQKCLKQCLDQTPAINSGTERERNQLEITMGPNSSRCSITLATYLPCNRLEVQSMLYTCIVSGLLLNFHVWCHLCQHSVVLPLPCSHPARDVLLHGMFLCSLCLSTATCFTRNVDYVGKDRWKVMCSYQSSSAGQISSNFLSAERFTFHQF